MTKLKNLAIIALLTISAITSADIVKENVKKPIIEGTPAFSLVFAPDFVACDIPRRFLVEIEFKKGFEATDLKYNEQIVKLLDTNELESNVKENTSPAPATRYLRRFYFQTLKRSDLTEITISGKTGAISIPLVIWDYDDLRETKTVGGTILPRRYPVAGSLPYLKSRQVFTPKPKGYKTEPVQVSGFIASRTYFNEKFNMKDFTFEEFWRITPDCSLAMRKDHPSATDPIYGDEVFKKAGNAFYAYRMTLAKPGDVDSYYFISPIDDRKIPSNDLIAGDYSSGDFVDDAVNGIELPDGKQHYYLSQYFVMRGLQTYDMISQAAELYESTGDNKYAQLALIGYCRLGLEHNYLSVLLNHRRGHFNKFQDYGLLKVAENPAFMGNCGFLFDGIWTTGQIKGIIAGYDKIFPGIKNDPKLFKFLQSKGLDINSKEDLQRFVEENVFLTYFQAMLDGSQQYNFPGTHDAFLKLVKMLDYPTEEFMDIVYEGDGNYLVNGLVTPLFMSGYYRDGVKGESLNGYNRNAINSLYGIYDNVSSILDNSTQKFDDEKYPRPTKNKKFIVALESQIQHATTPYTKINLGDSGTLEGYRRYYNKNKWFKTSDVENYFGDEYYQVFNNVYKNFPEPKLAWAMVNSDSWKLPNDYPYTLEEIEANAAKMPVDWREAPAVLSGPGVTILRNGLGDNERTLYSHYSNFHGHAQDSTMGIFIDAFKGRIVTNWGYPEAWDQWYYSWFSQNTGRQFPISKTTNRYFLDTKLEGYNEVTAKSGAFSVSDNKAQVVYDRGSTFIDDASVAKSKKSRYEILDGSQRRINFMVEVSDTEFYAIDLYNIAGGKDHWRTFHTLDGLVNTNGLKLTKQNGGTLAGADVEYNDLDWVTDFSKQGYGKSDLVYGIGFVRLTNVEKAKISSGDAFDVTWNVDESDGLKLKLWSLDSGDSEIVLADAKDPSGSRPIVRRMLLWHHQGDDGFHSQVVNVFEGYRNSPVIKNTRRMNVNGNGSGDFNPVGLEVKLDNRTDYIIASASDSKKVMVLPNGNKMILYGRIGTVSYDNNGKIIAQNIIAGSKLYVGKSKVAATKASYEAKIVGCDYDNWTITLSPKFENPNELLNKILHVKRGGITIPLEVRDAENRDENKTIVTVNCDPLSYTFKCRKIEDNKLIYKDFDDYKKWDYGRTEAALSIRRYYHGTSLFANDGTQYTLETLGRGQVRFVAGQKTDANNLGDDFTIGQMVNVYDYGKGDAITVVLEASLKN